jgi:ribosomal protein L37AE/L43A
MAPKKGHTPWNKGLAGIRVGEKCPNWKGGLPKCKVCRKELARRESKTILCRECFWKSEEGLKHAISHLPKPKYGKDHPNWTGGGTKRHRLMGRKKYILWRTAVFMKDDYTCQKCGARGKYMQADHIKPWAKYPELRYAIDNGRTLCVECHRQTDTWGYRCLRKGVD